MEMKFFKQAGLPRYLRSRYIVPKGEYGLARATANDAGTDAAKLIAKNRKIEVAAAKKIEEGGSLSDIAPKLMKGIQNKIKFEQEMALGKALRQKSRDIISVDSLTRAVK